MPLNRYQIATLNTPFDSTYLDVVRFDTRAAQQTYFNVSELFNGAPFINFDPKTLLNTDIYYVMPDGVPAEMLGHNYCIIKDNAAEVTPAYYYYFIKQSEFDAGKQVHLTLELDIYQTYYIDTEFQDCFITKAHLNRFIKNTPGEEQCQFDLRSNSNLWAREGFRDVPKRLIAVKDQRFGTPADTSGTTMSNWIRKNIAGWIYIYLKQNDDGYIFTSLSNPDAEPISTFNIKDDFGYNITPENTTAQISELSAPFRVLAAPIYLKQNKKFQINLDPQSTLGIVNFDASFLARFIERNGTAGIYAIKYSLLPPWGINFDPSTMFDYYISGDVMRWTMKQVSVDRYVKLNDNSAYIVCEAANVTAPDIDTQIAAAFYVLSQNLNDGHMIIPGDTDIYNEIINKSDLKGNRSYKFNPKIYMQDFTEVRVCFGSATWSYDLTKMGDRYLKYFEVMSPDITRIIMTIAPPPLTPDEDPIYIDDNEKILSGPVFSQDMGMPFSQNQLDTYLANNKNFYQQRDISLSYQEKVAGANFGLGVANSIIGGAFGAAGAQQNKTAFGRGLGAAKSIAGAGMGIIQGGVNYGLSLEGIENQRIQSDLTLDNMRNAPESILNINGNVFVGMGPNKYALQYQYYQALARDLAAADDQMFIYGYNYNRIDNVKNVDNIRHYFNYVRANLTTMSTPFGMPDEVHDAFRQLFERGLRMWNVTDQMFKYEKENYENWLDEEAGA